MVSYPQLIFNSKFMTKFKQTQEFTKKNIEKVPENKAILYKIKNASNENIYTGIAGRYRGQKRLLEHKELKKDKIPGGTKFQFTQVKTKQQAEKIEKQIIKKEEPRFNTQNKK